MGLSIAEIQEINERVKQGQIIGSIVLAVAAYILMRKKLGSFGFIGKAFIFALLANGFHTLSEYAKRWYIEKKAQEIMQAQMLEVKDNIANAQAKLEGIADGARNLLGGLLNRGGDAPTGGGIDAGEVIDIDHTAAAG